MTQQMMYIKVADLLDKVDSLREDGCRLVQICCTRVPAGFELTYSFDKDYHLYNLRLTVEESVPVMSITSLYWPAFIYENEMHDLFGVQVHHIADEVDYGGKFYRLAEKTPWNALPAEKTAPPRPAAKPAAAPSAAPPAGAKTEGGAQNG